ncbi:MAG: MBL fold metallo-hydrolase [Rhodocyclaceae bacterium]|nr:MBL fold metallo-hydrolase [Rhodocyclaceae bacterium]MDZ4215133.1 MBL fold metallo-hydrolase [Rhodocyclaceae bacterium]
MKLFSTFFLSILGLITSPARAWDAVPQRVLEGVYAFVGDTGPRSAANEGMNATTGFVVTGDGVVVIDSGSSKQVAQKIEAAIRQVTPQPIKLVINTGGQDHRWLGNGHFADQNIPIIASAATKADIADRGGMWASGMEKTLGPAFAGTRIQLPTRTFIQRETIALGSETLELIYAGGGHTPGDIIVWLPDKRVAFSGDLVFVDRLLGVLPVSKVKDWLASFDALAALNPQWIVPGHGTPTPLNKARHETRDYLALIYGHMQKAVVAGQNMQEAIRTLEDRAFASLPIYPELRGQNANRVYLEVESE